MQITTFSQPLLSRPLVRNQQPPSPPPQGPEAPQGPENDGPGPGHGELVNNLKFGAVAAVCGGLGYGASMAHNLPYVGSTISGLGGAVVGASAGALVASALPGEKVKTGAVLGLVGGAIVGSTLGGTLAGNLALGLAGATLPVGLLLAVFSG